MIKKSGLIVFLLFCFGTSYSQIRVESSIYDFGDILEENGYVTTVFELLNPYYDDTIHITNVTTSCGCTSVLTKDTLIFPRHKIKMEVSYNPKNRIGLFEKSIHIKTKTGDFEKNSLFIKIKGNVVGEILVDKKTTINLIKYEVAPLYFFPLTPFDTSFFDMNRIGDFINDISYEIDYHGFATVNFEIRLADRTLIPRFESLISFFKFKLIRELNDRNYSKETITFNHTVIIYDPNIPNWSVAKLKLSSFRFNNNKLKESIIKVTNTDNETAIKYIYNYNSDFIDNDNFIANIDMSILEAKLFKQGHLKLNAKVYVPEKKGTKKAKQIADILEKELFKKLKKLTGLSKKEFDLKFEFIGVHASTKYIVQLWDNIDNQSAAKIKYLIKPENILPPLLPVYKTEFITKKSKVNEQSIQFKQFWSALTTYVSSGKNIQLVIESSCSKYPKSGYKDPYIAAKEKGDYMVKYIQEKYNKETGRTIDIKLVSTVQGPEFETTNFTRPNYLKYEYIKVIPIFMTQREIKIKPIKPKPYQVNYDYYYVGVNVNSMVFKKFCEYLIYEIQTNGFVELRTESSTSKLLIDTNKSNEYWAFSHLNISKDRLFDYLRSKLVDPDRVVISNEKIIVQGIPHDNETPIVRYRKFQYVSFIPLKYL